MKKIFGIFMVGIFTLFILYFNFKVKAENPSNIDGYEFGEVSFINNSTAPKEIGINGQFVDIEANSMISYPALFKKLDSNYQFFYYGNEQNDFANSSILNIDSTDLTLEIKLDSLAELPIFYFVSTSDDIVVAEDGKILFVAKQMAKNNTLEYYTPDFKPIFIGTNGYTLNQDLALTKALDFSAFSLEINGTKVNLTTKGTNLQTYITELEELVASQPEIKNIKLTSEVSIWSNNSLAISTNLTWDLNGKQLYFGPEVSECIEIKGAEVTIVDETTRGLIASTDTLDFYYGHLFELAGKAKIHLNGGTMYAKRYAVYTATDSYVTINGSTIYAYTIAGADSGQNTSERYLYFLGGQVKSYGSFVFVMSNKVQKLYIVFGGCNYESYTQDFAYLDTANEIQNVLVTFTGNPTYIYVNPNKPYSIRHSYFNIDDENYSGDVIAIDGFGFKPVLGEVYLHAGLSSPKDFYKYYQYINSQDDSLKDNYVFGLDATGKSLILCQAVNIDYDYDSNINFEIISKILPKKLPLGSKYYLPDPQSFVNNGNLYDFLGFYTDSNYTEQITEITLDTEAIPTIYLKIQPVEVSISGPLEVTYGENVTYEVSEIIGDNLSYSWYLNDEKLLDDSQKISLLTTDVGISMQVYVVITGFIDGEKFTLTSNTIETTVNKADIDISNMQWSNTDNLTYSGQIYEVYLKNIPTELQVSYEDNQGRDVGTYQTTAHFLYNQNNYNPIADFTITWEISPKELLITIGNQSIFYQEELIDYELSYDGLVENDNESVINGNFSYKTIYQVGANVGEYQLDGQGLEAKNYNIEYQPGILTVKKIMAPAIVVEPIEIDYDSNITLNDIKLPTGVSFVAGQKLLEGENTYQAIYNPDPINYENAEITIVILANTSTPSIIYIVIPITVLVLVITTFVIIYRKKKK